MTKPELGSKRQCPKCATRFYDLGNDKPITCISCGNQFQPEVILKPRRPVAAEAAPPKAKVAEKAKPEDDSEDDSEIEALVDEDDVEDGDDDDIDSLLEVDDGDDDDDVDLDVPVTKDEDDK